MTWLVFTALFLSTGGTLFCLALGAVSGRADRRNASAARLLRDASAGRRSGAMRPLA